MDALFYCIVLVITKLTASQILGVNSPQQTNFANQNTRIPNGDIFNEGISNGMPFNYNNFLQNNQLRRNAVGNNLQNGNVPNLNNNVLPNLSNANLINLANKNMLNTNLGDLNTIGSNLPTYMNRATQMAAMNNANFGATNFMNTNLPNTLVSTKNTASPNFIEGNPANVQLNPSLKNFKNTDLLSNNFITTNGPNNLGNTGTNLGNNPNSYLAYLNMANTGNNFANANSGTPAFGLHLIADALEVGGTVSIAGRMPIYGTVVMNGNVPTDGAASVKYNCA